MLPPGSEWLFETISLKKVTIYSEVYPYDSTSLILEMLRGVIHETICHQGAGLDVNLIMSELQEIRRAVNQVTDMFHYMAQTVSTLVPNGREESVRQHVLRSITPVL